MSYNIFRNNYRTYNEIKAIYNEFIVYKILPYVICNFIKPKEKCLVTCKIDREIVL